MSKVCWTCLKYALLIVIMISSALTIYLNYTGSIFDPIKEIQSLRKENRRDDALDLAKFYREIQTGGQDKFARIENELTYSPTDKVKAFAWEGVIKGQVHDSYSGMGAVLADLCIVGDIRDLGIQGWKYVTGDQDFDGFITILSAAGIGFSSTAFLNGSNALAKNTVKYMKKVPDTLNTGLLKKFLSGKVSPENFEKIWQLLKKTGGQYQEPHPASAIFKI